MNHTELPELLIPTNSRPNYLKNLLESIPSDYEGKITVLNSTPKEDSELLKQYESVITANRVDLYKTSDIVLPPGAARKKLVEESTENLLLFLDDDLIFRKDSLINFIELFQRNDVLPFRTNSHISSNT